MYADVLGDEGRLGKNATLFLLLLTVIVDLESQMRTVLRYVKFWY